MVIKYSKIFIRKTVLFYDKENDIFLDWHNKFINSNNRKYLEPSLESLVENTSLIIQNPRKYGNEKSIKFIRDNFSWKKTVEKIYNIFDKNL